jgi:hypothetical protein
VKKSLQSTYEEVCELQAEAVQDGQGAAKGAVFAAFCVPVVACCGQTRRPALALP